MSNITFGGRTYDLKLSIDETRKTIDEVIAAKTARKIKYRLRNGGFVVSGHANRGDYCVWLPLSSDEGIKIITPMKDQTLQSLYENIQMIKGFESHIFPHIYNVDIFDRYVIVRMERMRKAKKAPKLSEKDKKWLVDDYDAAEKLLVNRLRDTERCMSEIMRLQLCPEDEWNKASNLIGGKIVDFHAFKHMPEMYSIPSVLSQQESEDIYKIALSRYKKRGDNKWKGKIYQGHRFDNGYVMEGYSSDGIEYDSYRKLLFNYMNKTTGARVLDLGCNEGFFSLQSYLHGAKKVVGVDLTSEDIALANDIKRIVGAGDALKFQKGNALSAIKGNQEWDVVIMNSVLHQIYANMEGADDFLQEVANKTQYFVYETPVNHPLMNISLEEIHQKLSKFFKIVRLCYLYDAYSTGYRANFVCYTFV